MARKGTFLAVAGLGLAAGVWAVQSGPVVRIRGRVVTDDVIVRGGQTYVPVSVLAEALQLRVRQSAGGCDLVGANDDLGQVQTRDGFRLELLDVTRTNEYQARYGYYDFSVRADEGQEVVVATFRLTNGRNVPQAIDLNNGRDTRLSDARLRSFAPLRGTGGRVLGGMLSIQSGTQADFALKFLVPRGFRPERLAVSVQNNLDTVPTTFRFSLGR